MQYLDKTEAFVSFIRAPGETVVQGEFVAEVVENRTSSEVGCITELA